MMTETDLKYGLIVSKLLDIEKSSPSLVIRMLARIKRVKELKKWFNLKYGENGNARK